MKFINKRKISAEDVINELNDTLVSKGFNANKGFYKARWIKPKNKEERRKFVEFWANYVRTHSDREWSKQQKVLIDSQIKSARKQLISLKGYLGIKRKSQKH